ncbi:lasso peptide biosynthesis B2 protein [Phenylobacterium aquaticum]|uniref:lasso peptide biosynthesis B2 protein n=1 Tax=Phenylobacterium aquaticum TaxID=1763816 RepID=UPI001F5DCB1A|nr:lasso peptide biosynthesis B2 protein [Phenylobacterium aquaticum]MCI3135391.1 lasso peptide biosynthesis B2 protein [Phenylobacterium aquaticum]
MAWYLTEQTRLAIRQDDLVLLDLVQGTYACLSGAGAALGRVTEAAEVCGSDPDLAAILIDAGALSDAPPPSLKKLVLPSLPRRDLTAVPRSPPQPPDLAALARAWAAMAHRYRGRSFAAILAAAQDDGREPAATPSARAQALANAFQVLRPWIPFQGLCLYRSFLLRDALRRRGEAAWWVFGVQTWPFEAHCWLQIGDVVLDDAAERVAAYTPILAV